jgi:hypothetical protein
MLYLLPLLILLLGIIITRSINDETVEQPMVAACFWCTIIDYDNSWDENLDKDLLNLAKRYADAGMMGRAKSAFTQAGGTWERDCFSHEYKSGIKRVQIMAVNLNLTGLIEG